MKTAATRYALAVGLLATLALTAATSAPAPIRAGAEARITVAQFCIPPESPEAHRYYCRHAGG